MTGLTENRMQNVPEELWIDEPQTEVAPAPQPPWGFWATLGWFALAAVLYVLMQVLVVFIVMIIIAATSSKSLNEHDLLESVSTSGMLLAVVTFVVNAVTLAFLMLAPIIRRASIREWFALRPVRPSQTIIAMIIVAVLIAASDLTTHLLNQPVVPEFMINAWKTAGFLPLLLAALIIAAPIFEEMTFRGFLFQGIARLRWGGIPAIIVTAALWAGIHLQYDWYGVTTLFVFGLVLGGVRLWTGSLILPILMHAVINLVASVETFYVVDVMK
jgi:uncharacterized protein